MRIFKIAQTAYEIERLHDKLKDALEHLNRNNIGKAKKAIKDSIKDVEEIRPHIKNKPGMEWRLKRFRKK